MEHLIRAAALASPIRSGDTIHGCGEQQSLFHGHPDDCIVGREKHCSTKHCTGKRRSEIMMKSPPVVIDGGNGIFNSFICGLIHDEPDVSEVSEKAAATKKQPPSNDSSCHGGSKKISKKCCANKAVLNLPGQEDIA